MSHRVFVKAQEIYLQRAHAWEDHYQKREQAKAFQINTADRALRACAAMPEPRLTMYGYLDTWNYNAARAKPIDDQIHLLREAGIPAELFVKWYWSEIEWQNFVATFNALPEPEPLYEMTMTSGYPRLEVVPYILGTSRGQVGTTAKLSPSVHRKTEPAKLSTKKR